MSNSKYHGLRGKIGGLAVKGMIRDVEQKMAEGYPVSAAPTSQAEAEHLEKIRQANRAGQMPAPNPSGASFS